jgi:4-oxalocrotonate tautomerase
MRPCLKTPAGNNIWASFIDALQMSTERAHFMPHVIVKLYAGRSEEVKQRLADEIVRDVVAVAKCDESAVSVAFEEFEPSDWPEKVYRPDILEKKQLLYKKPGYNPFE